MSAFYCGSVKKTSYGKRKYFQCSRSGRYQSKSTGQRSVKSQGLQKIGHYCTANIKLKIYDTQIVKATIFSLHYGHKKQLGHTRISKSDRLLVASQLSMGVEKTRILRNMFTMFHNNLERQHLITKQDIRNISKAFGIENIQKHPEDPLSVDLYVYQNENNIFLYKRQGEDCFHLPKDEPCTLEKNDFAVAIMTPFQKGMLCQFGNNIVCLDSTHGVTAYDFKVMTILVVDEFKEGIPVAWLLCNRETYTALFLFFNAIKKKVGHVNPAVIMTDKAGQFYAAFVCVFQANSKKLLCHWHVLKDWKNNLKKIHKSEELRSTIYKNLYVLLEEGDKDCFETMLETFIIKLFDKKETRDFGNYFLKEWVPIKTEWATCYRIRAEINTNMYVESFHNHLKHNEEYMKGKQGTRVNKCLNILLKFAEDLAVQRLRKLHKGKNTWKYTEIFKRHKASLELPLSLVKITSINTWQVFSEKSLDSEIIFAKNLKYDIKKQPACAKNCQIGCPECAICLHSYTCTCRDGILADKICKHVHLLVRYLKSDICEGNNLQENEDIQIPNSSACLAVPELPLSQNHPRLNPPSEPIKDLCLPINDSNAIFKDLASDEDLTLVKARMYAKIKTLTNNIEKCFERNLLLTAEERISSTSSLLLLKKHKFEGERRRQCNKNIEKQKTIFFSTKKKNLKNARHPRPNLEQEIDIKAGLNIRIGPHVDHCYSLTL